MLNLRKVYEVLAISAEISARCVLIISLAGMFAHAGSTLGAFDALRQAAAGLHLQRGVMLLMITVMMLIAGMLLDAVSIFLVFLPILLPIVPRYRLGPGLVRHHPDHEHGDRPVHAADGGQPDGHHPHRRR